MDTYTNKFGSSGNAVSRFTYDYDGWGNITKITDQANRTKTYTYNDFGEITEAVEYYGNGTTGTYAYTYDAGGNLLTETVNGMVNTYVYDSVWKDKLLSYNGKAITYDAAGHPLNYMGSTMTWDASDRLTTISDASAGGNGESIAYTYLSDGSRRSKTVGGVTTTYHYNNGLLLSQSTGDETLYFYYDSTGNVTSVGYKKGSADEAGYFFTRNAQGDIIGVYRSSDSKLIGTYDYDLWGKPVSVTEATAGIDTDEILIKNPFRYRGYYYDEETGFYYLNARYYDPKVRRFISADTIIPLTGSSMLAYNLFAYCWNNPVNMSDESGNIPFFVVTALVGAVAGAVVGGVIAAKTGGNVWAGIGIGAASGALLGAGLGACTAFVLTGSATASTGTVVSAASAVAAETATKVADAGKKLVSSIRNCRGGSFSKGVGNPVEVVGRGSTGRTVPNTLNEQMAMHQVMSNPLEGAVDMSQLKNHPVIMSDLRWLASEGWVKMSNNVNGVEIHFVYNKITGAFDDFKFK